MDLLTESWDVDNDVRPSSVDGAPAPTGRAAVVGIMLGTLVMGASGFLVLILTAAGFGAGDYALFGVFWSALYFVVAVVTGAQHEATRASLDPAPGRRTSLLVFALSLAAALFVVVAASSVWWSDAAFGEGHHRLGVLVAAGGAGFALNCVVAGGLAGAGAWGGFTAMLVVEGVVRAGTVAVVIAAGGSVESAAWVVVMTYPLTLAVVAPAVSRARVWTAHVPASLGRLWRNTAQTMTASAGVGALITGFPVLMSATSRDEPAAVLGALTLAVMLTRAPLLVPLTGMQSFLVSAFARPGRSPWPLLNRLLAAAVAVAAVLSLAAGLIGDQVLTGIFGEEFSVGSGTLALLVASSGGLAAMALVAPALIARGALAGNALAWVMASVVATIVLAAAPWGLGWRAGVSLAAGPCVGLVIQLVVLRRNTHRGLRSDGM